MEQQENQEEHLFDDNQYHLVQASGGKRFANYLVDRIVFYVLFQILAYFLAFFNLRIQVDLDPNSAGFALIGILIYMFAYALFMGLLEFAMKGKSIGKLLSGTRAVKEDGTHLELKDALLRGLCRLIPFNIFSALGNTCYPWHDSLSKTYVIDEQQSQYPL